MKKFSYVLAAGWVLISLLNVGAFLHSGLGFGLTGWIVSLILGATIYVSSYFAALKQTRFPALVVMVLSMSLDGVLNELEVTRIAGVYTLPDGNFLGIPPQILTYGYQAAALAVGASQTIFAAALGWLQSRVDKLPQKGAQKVSIWERIFPPLEGEVETAKRKIVGTNSENGKKGAGERVHKSELTQAQKGEIAAMTSAQIVAVFGGTLRRAEQWISAARSGEL